MIAKVRAELMAGLVHPLHEPLMLDGPLLYALVVERGECRDLSQGDVLELTAEPDAGMPIHVERKGGTWVYRCSAAEAVGYRGSYVCHWNNHLDTGLAIPMLQEGRLTGGTLNLQSAVKSGRYRSYHTPMYMHLVDALEWYVDCSDVDRLRSLLGQVRHLGKKRNSGNGAVLRWDVCVAAAEHGNRWLYDDAGRLVRPLPVAMSDNPIGTQAVPLPVRPPYWCTGHIEMCVMEAVVE